MSSKPTTKKKPDWYTATMLAEDRGLSGTWYRCERHGLFDAADVMNLGANAYCPKDDCPAPLILASKAKGWMDEHGGRKSWNDVATPDRPTAPAATNRPVAPLATKSIDAAYLRASAPEEPQVDKIADSVHVESIAEPAEPLEPEAVVDQVDEKPPELVHAPGDGTPTVRAADVIALLRRCGHPLSNGGMLQKLETPTSDRLVLGSRIRNAVFGLSRRGVIERVDGDRSAWRLTNDGAAAERPAKPVDSVAAENKDLRRQVEELQARAEEMATRPLVVQVTEPMTLRLLELLATGFYGHTVEDVAERFLSRALRAFGSSAV